MGAIASDSAQVVSPIKSIQRGVYVFQLLTSGDRTKTATITSVDTAKASVKLLSTIVGSGGNARTFSISVSLTSPTQLTIEQSVRAITAVYVDVGYEVIEYV